jgi:hypothetical protein
VSSRKVEALRATALRQSRSEPRNEAVATTALAAAGVAALGIACLANPASIESGPVLCPFRLVTGLPCPGCGLTRSWVYIAHGDFGEAIRANAFGYLTMGAAIALIIVVATAVLLGRPIPSLSPVARSRPFLLAVGGWLVFAAVRIVAIAVG